MVLGSIWWCSKKNHRHATYSLRADSLLSHDACAVLNTTLADLCQQTTNLFTIGQVLLASHQMLKQVSCCYTPHNRLGVYCSVWGPVLGINESLVILANGSVVNRSLFTATATAQLMTLKVPSSTLDVLINNREMCLRLMHIPEEVFKRYYVGLFDMDLWLQDRCHKDMIVRTNLMSLLDQRVQRACEYIAQEMPRTMLAKTKTRRIIADVRFKDQIVISRDGGGYEGIIIF
jgi:hypothetical protein